MSMSTAEPSSNRVIVMPQDQESDYCEVVVEIAGYHLRKPSPHSRGDALTVALKIAYTLDLSEVPRGPDHGENYAVYFRSTTVTERKAAQGGVAIAPGETDSSARARAVAQATGDRVAATLACWIERIASLRAEYAAADNKLQREWSAEAGQLGYSKRSWQDRSNALDERYRELLDALGYNGPLLPGGRRAEVCGLPVFDADGRQIVDAVLAGVTVTARVTDEHAAAVLRASLRGVSIEADPAHPVQHEEPVAPPTDARLREIASGECGPNRQEVAAMASGLLLSRNALRYHEEHDRLRAAAQAADPAIAAIAATCEHRFFDDAGSRVYLYCQRGCGTRDPLESATPATADERGR